MKYKAVGFDWGGVLNGRPSKFFGHDIAQLLDITYEDYLAAYFRHNKKVNRGEVTWEELWTLVLGELGQPDKVPEVLRLGKEANADNLNQDVLDLADELRGVGLKTGLLSNNTYEKAASMRASGLDRHFDVFHISAETGFVKPEPEAFGHFAQALGVQLPELIFIDDSEKSLSTAQECGFVPVLFESCAQLREQLARIGI